MTIRVVPKTPWQKVFAKLGIQQRDVAEIVGKNPSNVSRALSSETGIIAGVDQIRLVRWAKANGIELTLEDFQPGAV